MPISLIPWQFFNKELQQQNCQTVQTWLVRWAFTNGGAALVHGREKHEAPPLSLEEKQKRATHFLMTMGKRPKTIH